MSHQDRKFVSKYLILAALHTSYQILVLILYDNFDNFFGSSCSFILLHSSSCFLLLLIAVSSRFLVYSCLFSLLLFVSSSRFYFSLLFASSVFFSSLLASLPKLVLNNDKLYNHVLGEIFHKNGAT